MWRLRAMMAGSQADRRERPLFMCRPESYTESFELPSQWYATQWKPLPPGFDVLDTTRRFFTALVAS
jgi:hypothetical protein